MSHEISITSRSQNTLFPIFLKLEQLHVLLVGGGKIGLEKLNAMLTNAPSAKINVVAEWLSDEIKQLAGAHSDVLLQQKSFEASDLEGKDVVIIAVNDRVASLNIRNAAKQRRLLVNVADTPDLCDFYLGAIVQKGAVKIAISTNGKSPTLARRLKEVLQQTLPDAIHTLADHLHAIRSRLKGDFATKVEALNRITERLVEKEKTKSP
jgi:siroheme synthase-like protein